MDSVWAHDMFLHWHSSICAEMMTRSPLWKKKSASALSTNVLSTNELCSLYILVVINSKYFIYLFFTPIGCLFNKFICSESRLVGISVWIWCCWVGKQFPVPPLNGAAIFLSAVWIWWDDILPHELLALCFTEIRGGKVREREKCRDHQHEMTSLKEMNAGCTVETLSYYLLAK